MGGLEVVWLSGQVDGRLAVVRLDSVEVGWDGPMVAAWF